MLSSFSSLVALLAVSTDTVVSALPNQHVDVDVNERGLLSIPRPRLVIDDFRCVKPAFQTADFRPFPYDEIYEDVRALLPGRRNRRNSLIKWGDMAGCGVRLAAHDFLDFRRGGGRLTGGADGCFNLGTDENRGLSDCTPQLGKIYQKYCGRVSLPDFIVAQAEAFMAISSRCEETTKIKFKRNFKFGRKHCGKEGQSAFQEQQNWAKNPFNAPLSFNSGDKGLRELQHHLFGGSVEMSVAILGAHTLGRVVEEDLAGGLEGWWDGVRKQSFFDNNYYKSLINKGWALTEGQSSNAAFARSDQVCSRQLSLRIDMALVWKIDSSSKCCAYVDPRPSSFEVTSVNGVSGTLPKNAACLTKGECCAGFTNAVQCGFKQNSKSIVFDYARNNQHWLTAFHQAWKIATTNGSFKLKPLVDSDLPVNLAFHQCLSPRVGSRKKRAQTNNGECGIRREWDIQVIGGSVVGDEDAEIITEPHKCAGHLIRTRTGCESCPFPKVSNRKLPFGECVWNVQRVQPAQWLKPQIGSSRDFLRNNLKRFFGRGV